MIDLVSPIQGEKEPDSTQSTPVVPSKYNCAICWSGFKTLDGFKKHQGNKVGNYGCYRHYKTESKKAIMKAEESCERQRNIQKRKSYHYDLDEEEKTGNHEVNSTWNRFLLDDDEDDDHFKMEMNKENQ